MHKNHVPIADKFRLHKSGVHNLGLNAFFWYILIERPCSFVMLALQPNCTVAYTSHSVSDANIYWFKKFARATIKPLNWECLKIASYKMWPRFDIHKVLILAQSKVNQLTALQHLLHSKFVLTCILMNALLLKYKDNYNSKLLTVIFCAMHTQDFEAPFCYSKL